MPQHQSIRSPMALSWATVNGGAWIAYCAPNAVVTAPQVIAVAISSRARMVFTFILAMSSPHSLLAKFF